MNIPTILDEVRAEGMRLPPHMNKPLGGAVAAARAKGRAERRPQRPPRVVLVHHMGERAPLSSRSLVERSKAEPETVFSEITGRRVIRGGLIVSAPRLVRRALLVLFAAQGRLVSRGDLVQALYGDREDGGADNAEGAVSVVMTGVRDVAAALGFRIENFCGLGFRLTDGRA